MNKIMIWLLSCLMIGLTLASAVSAFGFPQIISGQVTIDGEPFSELDVSITNLRTGQVFKPMTGGNGIFTAEVNENYAGGDRFRISVCSNNPECTKEVTTQSGVPLKVNWDIDSPGFANALFTWRGITVSGSVLVALLSLIAAGYTTQRKNAVLKSWARELLQNAENVVIGKLRDIKEDGELTSDFKKIALEYEIANKNRSKVRLILEA